MQPAGVVDAVVACVDGLPAVTVDVPSGVALLGADLARALRDRGVDVTVDDDRTLVDAVRWIARGTELRDSHGRAGA